MVKAISSLRTPLPPLPVVSGSALLFGGLGIVLAYLVLPPLALLIQASFLVSTGLNSAQVSAGNYVSILSAPDLATLFINTLAFAAGGAMVAMVIGCAVAFLLERTDAPFKSVAYGSMFVALAIPNVIKIIGWVLLLGPNNGLITTTLASALHVDRLPFYLYSVPGLIVVNGLNWVPGVVLLMCIPFRTMDATLEEAAAMHGANGWTVFRRVTLPLARPAVLAVLLLTFVQSLENFETPAVIGLPGRVYVLSTRIYAQLRQGIVPDFGLISAYALLLMCLVALGIVLYVRATRDAQRFQTLTGKGYRQRVARLGWWRLPAGALVALLPALVALPFFILAWSALQPAYTRPSLDDVPHFTLAHFANIIGDRKISAALMNTVIVSVAAATITVGLTAATAWVVLRTRVPGRRLLDSLAAFTLVFPGIVLAVALARTYISLPVPVFGTLLIFIVAYVTRGIPYALRYVQAGLIQVDQQLEESAQMSGASGLTIFRRILAPLILPALFSAWVWVFLQSASEVTMATILAGPDAQLVSSTIFDLYLAGSVSELAALSVLVAAALMLLATVLNRASGLVGVRATLL